MAFGAPLSVAQVAADCGLTTRGVRLVLESLASQGLVHVLGQPRSQLYSVAMLHPMAGALKSLFAHEHHRWESLQETLRQALGSWREVRSAWLYGSVARGEDRPGSDVDILLVLGERGVDVSHRVRDAVQALGDRLGLHFSAVVLAPEELAAVKPGDAWWSDVVRDAKVLKGVSPAKEAARCAKTAQTA
jgi:predicted nucleotidyltransferase